MRFHCLLLIRSELPRRVACAALQPREFLPSGEPRTGKSLGRTRMHAVSRCGRWESLAFLSTFFK
jgi:hypothetical protein